ncbi:MAG TPA: 4-hydroxythreonine-4-phosphate dehydrogenase PdxA [Candidatus Eisenbacteria bacterium]|nr:4-hydroxythreonine-4-phosphate dehydrogenase PdxA [Candidatus Eisenbacteria bacterium]
MALRRPTLLITCGDPAGIGPEIAARAVTSAALRRVARLAVVGDAEIFERALHHTGRTGARAKLRVVRPDAFDPKDDSPGIPFLASSDEGWISVSPGHATAGSGRAAAKAIEAAAGLALERRVDGIVTAPISKHALRMAGYPHPGHTEFLGALAGARETRMLFVTPRFRLILATVHLALRDVPGALSAPSLVRTIEFAAAASRNFRWGARRPVALLGLNPHAGEEGLFGDEEERFIRPAIREARERGIKAEGPFPADTFFSRRDGGPEWSAVIAMYHDQGLIPAKAEGIGGAANVTLGLPFVRSSVDHGTAFDRAWKSARNAAARPDPAGLFTAVRVGADLALRAGRKPMEWSWP